LTKDQALQRALEKGLDLVEVNPAATPPVAKILDFGKFSYQQRKNERKAKKRAVALEQKSVRIGVRTSAHDLATKAARIEKFLEKGHTVRVEIFLRGREKAHQELARERLEAFLTRIGTTHRTIDQIRKVPSGFVTTISK
jgi:translation initiation factor IF-3